MFALALTGALASCSDDDNKGTANYKNPYSNPLTDYSAADPTVWKENDHSFLFAPLCNQSMGLNKDSYSLLFPYYRRPSRMPRLLSEPRQTIYIYFSYIILFISLFKFFYRDIIFITVVTIVLIDTALSVGFYGITRNGPQHVIRLHDKCIG